MSVPWIEIVVNSGSRLTGDAIAETLGDRRQS